MEKGCGKTHHAKADDGSPEIHLLLLHFLISGFDFVVQIFQDCVQMLLVRLAGRVKYV